MPEIAVRWLKTLRLFRSGQWRRSEISLRDRLAGQYGLDINDPPETHLLRRLLMYWTPKILTIISVAACSFMASLLGAICLLGQGHLTSTPPEYSAYRSSSPQPSRDPSPQPACCRCRTPDRPARPSPAGGGPAPGSRAGPSPLWRSA